MKAYKTEIHLRQDQQTKLKQTIGVRRYVYNLCISHNKEIYEKEKKFVTALGYVKLKEYGYLPTDKMIRSGRVSEVVGRFYVSVLTNEEPKKQESALNNTGLGVDLGIKEFAVVSNGSIYENKNKTGKMKKLEKTLKREQRSLSQKYENKKRRGEKLQTKKSANIEKNVLRVQKLNQELSRKRHEYIRYI